MIGLVLMLGALAAEPADPTPLTWDLRVGGNVVGERTATVKVLPGDAQRRVIESTTGLEAAALGVRYGFEQRMTVHAGGGPASFHSVLRDNGQPREIQARYTAWGWVVTIAERGRDKTWEMPADEIDLSTADLLDPQSAVPLRRFEDEVRVLSAETGDVWTAAVEPLGPSEVTIGSTAVPVQGYALELPTGKSRFYYSSGGYLVRSETRLLGKSVEATLRTPPPAGADEAPVDISGGSVEEIEL